MSNLQELLALYEPFSSLADGMLTVHYIAPVHFVGGSLIVFGLLTRWAIIAQLPVLLAAVLINFIGDLNAINLALSTVVILLCVFFLIYGSGKHSVDYYMKMQQ